MTIFDPLTVTCPTCDAPPPERCQTERGLPRPPHAGRTYAARRAARAARENRPTMTPEANRPTEELHP